VSSDSSLTSPGGPEEPSADARSSSVTGVSSRFLIGLRDCGLHVVIFLLIVFPVVVAGREFVVFLLQDPTWAPLLSFFDAGAQRPMSRAVLRTLLIGGCLFGLLLPTSGGGSSKRALPWVGFFLLSGLLSVGMSGRPYAAEMEWEAWALTALLAVLIRWVDAPALRVTALVALYVVSLSIFFHALWISVPGTLAQLGGVFHHPNALSTFTLFVLPFLIDRACRGGLEGYLASFLTGSTLALAVWAGSLTGACLLVVGATCWLMSRQALWRRWAVCLVVLPLPVLFNLMGGWMSAVGFTVLFLVLLSMVVYRLGNSRFAMTLVFLLSLVVSCAAFAYLAPIEMSGKSSRDRANSATARLTFYRAALFLTAEEPILGQGPSAFTREYPRYQESVQYFSRYVHCIPLEILMEWGLLGFVFGAMACYTVVSQKPDSLGRASTWAFAAFGLHCLTGVQSQFPYLLVMVAMAWALTREPPEEAERRFFWAGTLGRVCLTVALLGLLSLNALRLESAVNQNLATRIFSSPDPQARAFAVSLFQSSVRSQPMDGQALLAYAQVQMRMGEETVARWVAEDAIETDHQWAAPRRVELLSSPPPPRSEAVARALEADGINYPLFYRLQAESMVTKGKNEDALDQLLSRVENYDPLLLNRLPDFRARDLDGQLVEYWLLIALLQERAGRPELAETAFRRSLYFTRRALPRYRKMVGYPSRSGLNPGPIVAQLLSQLAQQIPAE
jgi:tetratricopeptide (TPR) repeat protein